MQIVPYPHPALSFKSVDLKQIDATLRKTVGEMFDLMYEANGIGLAANQVGLPFRFFIVNLASRPEEADEEMVFLNPVLTRKRGTDLGEEGCLSLPGLYGDVRRASDLIIEAFDLNGAGFRMELDDLAARVVQHENDHLDGVLFTDRMREEGTSAKLDIKIPRFVTAWQQAQRAGHIPGDEAIRDDLKRMAQAGTVPEDFLTRPALKIATPELKD
ncbi:peptide deformylase [Planctomicrobium piriforme]|uniref:Peptide deformylase n=1 Tax=Planctomicrobium piriforme TaxID=1576369 RepID=A0A1I3PHH3_9PLAN|nr:peptide deformylase [Planctomicrobium piriforme]SFJ20797.1 peptide deformylase [Planctomicrobium piriforme]